MGGGSVMGHWSLSSMLQALKIIIEFFTKLKNTGMLLANQIRNRDSAHDSVELLMRIIITNGNDKAYIIAK
jgi:hypothetical protein